MAWICFTGFKSDSWSDCSILITDLLHWKSLCWLVEAFLLIFNKICVDCNFIFQNISCRFFSFLNVFLLHLQTSENRETISEIEEVSKQ